MNDLLADNNIIKEGDIVTRYSYNHDVFFKVVSINVDKNGEIFVKLKGLDVRLEATASLSDLMIRDPLEVCIFCYRVNLNQSKKIENILQKRYNCVFEK